MNLTYLLGAGASAKALPTVANFSRKMIEMAAFFKALEYDSRNLDQNFTELPLLNIYKNHLINNLEKFAGLSYNYSTPDTYAKYLFLNKNKELSNLKTTLSLFIYLSYFKKDFEVESQFGNFVSITPSDTFSKYISKLNIENIDSRYIPLLVSLLETNALGMVNIPDKVNFISWNYDVQLELALSKLSDNYDFNTMLGYHKVFPFSEVNNHKIVHLNGIAGYNTNGDNDNIGLKEFNGAHFYEEDMFLSKAFERLFPYFNKTNLADSYYKRGSGLNFAWENSSYSEQAVNKAVDIMRTTDIFVVIGYSFPFFNRSIDKRLFSVLKSGSTIYYQDINASGANLKDQFRITSDKQIFYLDNVDQFFIPSEYVK